MQRLYTHRKTLGTYSVLCARPGLATNALLSSARTNTVTIVASLTFGQGQFGAVCLCAALTPHFGELQSVLSPV